MPYTSTDFLDPVENRVIEAIKLFAEQEAQHYLNNPRQGMEHKNAVERKLHFYESVQRSLQKTANTDEKIALRYISGHVRKLAAQLRPTRYNSLVNSPAVIAIRNFVNGNNLLFKQLDGIIEGIRTEVFHKHNAEHLARDFKASGFDLSMESQLDKMLSLNIPAFQLAYYDMKNNSAAFTLHCQKIAGTELYEFRKFDVIAVTKINDQHPRSEKPVQFSVYPGEQNTLTATEAAKIASGKTLLLEDQLAYLTEPVKGKHEVAKVECNLEKEIKRLKLPAFSDKEMTKLRNTLSKGEGYTTTVTVQGKGEIKCTMIPTPNNSKAKLNLFDLKGNFIDYHKVNCPVSKQSENNSTEQKNSLSGFEWETHANTNQNSFRI